MKNSKVPLYDNIRKSVIEAELVEGIPLDQIAQANARWIAVKQKYRNLCKMNNTSYPEHSHWDWDNKAAKSKLFEAIQTRFAIVYQGEIQGLMLVEQATHLARLAPDKGDLILYIKYLETAPHNMEVYVSPRRFSGIGIVFLSSAIDYSIEAGSDGRVGLHALPQAEQFYDFCGMTRFEKDPTHEYLHYYEWTSRQAKAFQTFHGSSKDIS